MQVDVLADPFDGRWDDLRDAALAAEAAGFGGLWLYDHLAGSVHGAGHVLECWTALSALAATTERMALGTLVLNVANRDPGTLAVMAATFQEVSGGRLLLGVGAGGGAATPYAREQWGLGRDVPSDPARRSAVSTTIDTLRSVWTGTAGGVRGYLPPDPVPPVIVGGFGPRMAELAGRQADGLNCPPSLLDHLLPVARRARDDAGLDPDDFLVTTSAVPAPTDLRRLAERGVDRAIVMIRPPYRQAVEALAPRLEPPA